MKNLCIIEFLRGKFIQRRKYHAKFTNTHQKLFELLEKAKQDKVLKQKLLDTKKEKDPTLAFCELATKEGFPITVGELFAEGEEYISNLLKSVNGGATYPREGWDDPYEMFFASLERI